MARPRNVHMAFAMTDPFCLRHRSPRIPKSIETGWKWHDLRLAVVISPRIPRYSEHSSWLAMAVNVWDTATLTRSVILSWEDFEPIVDKIHSRRYQVKALFMFSLGLLASSLLDQAQRARYCWNRQHGYICYFILTPNLHRGTGSPCLHQIIFGCRFSGWKFQGNEGEIGGH